MKAVRPFLFWTHLVLGVAAGGVILITVVTGALMAYQRQIVAAAERPAPGPAPAADARPLPMAEVVARASTAAPDAGKAVAVTVSSEPRMPVRVEFEGERGVAVDPYTGVATPLPAGRARAAFRWIENCHRRLGSGETGARIVGVSAAVFLGLCVSGLVLWFPRKASAKAFLAVMRPRLGLPARARDWNWHNAVGFWCSIPLSVMAFTGLVMVFRGFGDWVYGPQAGRGGGPGGGEGPVAAAAAAAPAAPPLPLAELVSRVVASTSDWSEVTVRTGEGRGGRGGRGGPRPEGRGGREGRGDGEGRETSEVRKGRDRVEAEGGRVGGPEGRPPGREERPGGRGEGPGRGGRMATASIQRAAWRLPETVRLDPATGERLASPETAPAAGLGARLRPLNRVIHTGEIGGVAGQTLTLAACLGAMVLVYTGFALAFRRVFARSVRPPAS